jgi:hypothetical protein
MKANEVEYDGLFYRINPDDKTAVLSKSNSSNPLFRQEQMLLDFKIPSVMYCNNEEYTVIGIGDRAFMECHAFESVDLPTSIDFMDRDAFFYCKSLKKVIIRGDVEIPLFKGVFNHTNLSEIHWYGDILKLHTFLSHMVSNESAYHPDYDAITIHIRKDSDATEVSQWLEKYRFRNDENGVEAKFKIVKDL